MGKGIDKGYLQTCDTTIGPTRPAPLFSCCLESCLKRVGGCGFAALDRRMQMIHSYYTFAPSFHTPLPLSPP